MSQYRLGKDTFVQHLNDYSYLYRIKFDKGSHTEIYLDTPYDRYDNELLVLSNDKDEEFRSQIESDKGIICYQYSTNDALITEILTSFYQHKE